MRLVSQSGTDWKDRAHFIGVVVRVMRQVLVDHARRLGAEKRRADEAYSMQYVEEAQRRRRPAFAKATAGVLAAASTATEAIEAKALRLGRTHWALAVDATDGWALDTFGEYYAMRRIDDWALDFLRRAEAAGFPVPDVRMAKVICHAAHAGVGIGAARWSFSTAAGPSSASTAGRHANRGA